jgi:hypothetical protein
VVQNNDNGIVLKSNIAGHIVMFDLETINRIINVLVLQISASPFNEVVLPLLWTSFVISFMLSLRVRSDLCPLGSVHYL